jgi:putative transposase
VAITRQNSRSISRRCDGAPGDFIGERPVNSFIHPAGRPINYLRRLEVLRRPVESGQFRSRKFHQALARHGLIGSMGNVASAADNAAMESFFALLQRNVLDRRRWDTRDQLRIAILTWIERTYHRRRRQVRLGRLTPIEYETIMPTPAPEAA